MKPILLWTGLMLIASAAPCAEIDRLTTSLAGQEAEFIHSFTPKGFQSPQVESGTVIFGRLPSMRWTYSRPEAKVFVFDGSRSWFYVPADKQVTVVDLDEQHKRELPLLVFGDRLARDRLFTVREQNRGAEIASVLEPRDTTGQIRTITVVSAASSHLITSIDYTDREGNRTQFRFSGYHPARLSEETFRFAVPAGVQVVRGD